MLPKEFPEYIYNAYYGPISKDGTRVKVFESKDLNRWIFNNDYHEESEPDSFRGRRYKKYYAGIHRGSKGQKLVPLLALIEKSIVGELASTPFSLGSSVVKDENAIKKSVSFEPSDLRFKKPVKDFQYKPLELRSSLLHGPPQGLPIVASPVELFVPRSFILSENIKPRPNKAFLPFLNSPQLVRKGRSIMPGTFPEDDSPAFEGFDHSKSEWPGLSNAKYSPTKGVYEEQEAARTSKSDDSNFEEKPHHKSTTSTLIPYKMGSADMLHTTQGFAADLYLVRGILSYWERCLPKEEVLSHHQLILIDAIRTYTKWFGQIK